MLVAGQPASALSNYLLQVETESMGLKGDHDRAELVAAKLQRVV
jgi:hypothetical protein